ncbi:ATP-dependent RNA helicase DBP9 [Aulographum hederae CBS 113979]|uniref:RNA helicase n=1 Tax=Aulographum hederae CBS 113979 TaxID=1176131 RepID=A0A6G1H6H6_9PEZI|nr:ATP-dependent RNA helicase DBP9 [Aulographum hederae CBS 113979]
MKRKLNAQDVPEEVQTSQKALSQFQSLGLDPRILQGIAKEAFSEPTPIQAKAIPLALEGKDILARSKTGSGKTAAYILPILQSTLKRKANSPSKKCTSALILVPTRELAGQVTKAITALAALCSQDIKVENVTRNEDEKVQRARLAALPDIVVATPSRASSHVNSSALSLNDLAHLVIDEADLVLSYGHDADLQNISKAMPKGVQTFLISATLNTEIESLKGLFCQDPVAVEMDEEEKDSGSVKQYVVKVAEEEKFLLAYAIFKLKLIRGKAIIFVGDIDRSYRLKLFLEQFGIKSCVLNSELPVNSRIHVVEEFNKGIYDIIIASDEHEVLGDEGKKDEEKKHGKGKGRGTKEDKTADTAESPVQPAKKRQKNSKTSTKKDYGVARGIDFRNVSCVLNFDLPTTSKSYTHRIGRTARAGKTGMALSFVIPANLYHKHKPTTFPTTKHDEEVLAKIEKSQAKKGLTVKPYHFDMKKLDGFRYRMVDALRAVTSMAVKNARIRELRQELIKSEKLKRHFEENPEELQHLRHDGELRSARIQHHLKHVPDYLLPGGAGKKPEDVGFVAFAKDERQGNRIRKARMANRGKGRGKKVLGRKGNPLQTFKGKGK